MKKAAKTKAYSKADLTVVSDNPAWSKADMAKAKRFDDVFPDLAASIKRGRGPNKAPTKTLVSLRLSPDVLDHFKSSGPGWQTRIDNTLRKAAKLKSREAKT